MRAKCHCHRVMYGMLLPVLFDQGPCRCCAGGSSQFNSAKVGAVDHVTLLLTGVQSSSVGTESSTLHLPQTSASALSLAQPSRRWHDIHVPSPTPPLLLQLVTTRPPPPPLGTLVDPRAPGGSDDIRSSIEGASIGAVGIGRDSGTGSSGGGRCRLRKSSCALDLHVLLELCIPGRSM